MNKIADGGLAHKALHAVSGGIQGWILRGEKGITAAALGSFVAECVAEAVTPTGGLGKIDPKDRPVYSAERIQLTQDVARLTASMAALLAGMDEKDIAIAISTATVAVENNFAESARKISEGQGEDAKEKEAEDPELANTKKGDQVDESGYESAGRTTFALKAVEEFQRQKDMVTPSQREGWKQIGRTEESVFQNAYADKQRMVFFEIHKKETRGESLTETEWHIKAIGFSQAPDFIRDIGFAAFGGVGAKGFMGRGGGPKMRPESFTGKDVKINPQISKTKPGGVIRSDSIPEGSKLEYLAPGRVKFDGVEFRAVRDLGHLNELQLDRMIRKGTNPKSIDNIRLDGHHFKQRYHREPGAFMAEIPDPKHCISNPAQHPLGSTGGLTREQRADWDALRMKFNKERAKTELMRRGVNHE